MSFQAYLDNVQGKTRKTPDDFRRLAEARGLAANDALLPGIKATQVTDWLKADFGLGHGHATAVYAMLTGKKA